MDELRAHWDVTVGGMLWMQGESDSFPAEYTAAYQDSLSLFIAEVRAELETPNLPVVLGKITVEPWKGCGADSEGVRAIQDAVASADPLVTTIETDDLSKIGPVPDDCVVPPGNDPFHYDAAGQVELGSRFADAMAQLQGL